MSCEKGGERQFETVEVMVLGENSQNVWIEPAPPADAEDGEEVREPMEPIAEGDLLVMDPGYYKELMDLPEMEGESRIEIPEGTMEISSPAAGDANASEGGGRNRDNDVSQAEGERSQQGERGRGGRGEGRRGEGGGGGPGGGGGFSVDMIVDRTMERYDTNGDGKIDQEEQKGFDERAQRMSGADSNGDGDITRDEIKTYMDAMMKRMQQQGGFGGGRPSSN